MFSLESQAGGERGRAMAASGAGPDVLADSATRQPDGFQAHAAMLRSFTVTGDPRLT